MPKLDKNSEWMLAIARQQMDRHRVALSVLAQGENSPYMTEEFKQTLEEAKEKVAPYTISVRAAKAAKSEA